MKINKELLKHYENADILKLGIDVYAWIKDTDWIELKKELDDKKIYSDIIDYDEFNNEYFIYFDYDEYIENYELFNKIKNITLDYDNQLDTIDNLIEQCFKYDHYLMYNDRCNWRGCLGYKIVDNTADELFYRNYDCSLIYKKCSKFGKVLKFNEFSHDVPTGGNLYYIGLTDKEYELIDNDKIDIKNFVEKHIGGLNG